MNKLTIIWIILTLLTLFAFSLGWLEVTSSSFIFALLLTTLIKGQLVIDYFMGLSEIRLKYRIIPTIWISCVILLIGIAYYTPATN